MALNQGNYYILVTESTVKQLIKQVDEYAATLHVNRTAAVSVLLSRALQADKLAADLSDLMDAYRVQSGKIPVSIDEVGAAVDR